MKDNQKKITLDRQVTYQIKVPGSLDPKFLNWNTELKINIESDASGQFITTITSKFDQASLLGFLNQLYSQGIPLLSVIYIQLN